MIIPNVTSLASAPVVTSTSFSSASLLYADLGPRAEAIHPVGPEVPIRPTIITSGGSSPALTVAPTTSFSLDPAAQATADALSAASDAVSEAVSAALSKAAASAGTAELSSAHAHQSPMSTVTSMVTITVAETPATTSPEASFITTSVRHCKPSFWRHLVPFAGCGLTPTVVPAPSSTQPTLSPTTIENPLKHWLDMWPEAARKPTPEPMKRDVSDNLNSQVDHCGKNHHKGSKVCWAPPGHIPAHQGGTKPSVVHQNASMSTSTEQESPLSTVFSHSPSSVKTRPSIAPIGPWPIGPLPPVHPYTGTTKTAEHASTITGTASSLPHFSVEGHPSGWPLLPWPYGPRIPLKPDTPTTKTAEHVSTTTGTGLSESTVATMTEQAQTQTPTPQVQEPELIHPFEPHRSSTPRTPQPTKPSPTATP